MNAQLLRQLGVDQQVLTQMVDEQVAVLEAERQGIRVSDDELAQRIFAIPGLQENGRFIGEARYEQLLRQQRPPLTKAQFEDRFRRGIMVERLRTALTDWMAVSDTELEAEYRKRNEKVKLQVVALTADSFRDKVSLSDADVAAYFEAHKAEYRVGEQRSIKYLLIDRDQVRLKIVVPPERHPALLQRQHPAVPDAGTDPRQPHPAEDRRQGRSGGAQARRGAAGAGEGRRRLRRAGEEGVGRRGLEGHRRRPRLLRPRPHGARVRDRGVRDAAGADERSGALAVRLPHHPRDREEGGRNAAARRSAAADSGTAGAAAGRPAGRRSAPSSCRRASRIPAIWPKRPASRG